MLETPTDTAAAKRALVRTYNPPAYADPWDCVQDFERVQREAAKHPNKGSAALASVVELPRGRIRSWLEGSQPDCYRDLQTALSNGWLIETWDRRGRGLNCLAAWLLSSGGIDKREVATWIADSDTELAALESYADALESVVEDDIPEDTFLVGPSGGGKTCIARYSLEELQQERVDIDTHYVDCWQHSNRFRVLYKVLGGVDPPTMSTVRRHTIRWSPVWKTATNPISSSSTRSTNSATNKS